jgi:hypothetical protein
MAIKAKIKNAEVLIFNLRNNVLGRRSVGLVPRRPIGAMGELRDRARFNLEKAQQQAARNIRQDECRGPRPCTQAKAAKRFLRSERLFPP